MNAVRMQPHTKGATIHWMGVSLMMRRKDEARRAVKRLDGARLNWSARTRTNGTAVMSLQVTLKCGRRLDDAWMFGPDTDSNIPMRDRLPSAVQILLADVIHAAAFHATH